MTPHWVPSNGSQSSMQKSVPEPCVGLRHSLPVCNLSKPSSPSLFSVVSSSLSTVTSPSCGQWTLGVFCLKLDASEAVDRIYPQQQRRVFLSPFLLNWTPRSSSLFPVSRPFSLTEKPEADEGQRRSAFILLAVNVAPPIWACREPSYLFFQSSAYFWLGKK